MDVGGSGLRSSRGGRLALRLLVAAAVLAALVAVVPRQELAAALRTVPPWVWAAAPVVFLAVHLIGVAKWRLLVNAAGADLSLRVALRCYYAGLFGNLFLPTVVGGDAVRAALALRDSRSKSGLVLASVIDRLLDLTSLAVLAAAAVASLPYAAGLASNGSVQAVLTAAAGALVAGWLLLRALPIGRLPYRLRRRLAEARRALRRLRRRPRELVLALLLSATLQLALLGLAIWLGRQVGVDRDWTVWLFVWPLAKLAALAPVSQGGIGVREVALVALFRPFGVPAATALAAGLVFEAALVAGSGVGGLLVLLLARDGDTVSKAPRG